MIKFRSGQSPKMPQTICTVSPKWMFLSPSNPNGCSFHHQFKCVFNSKMNWTCYTNTWHANFKTPSFFRCEQRKVSGTVLSLRYVELVGRLPLAIVMVSFRHSHNCDDHESLPRLVIGITSIKKAISQCSKLSSHPADACPSNFVCRAMIFHRLNLSSYENVSPWWIGQIHISNSHFSHHRTFPNFTNSTSCKCTRLRMFEETYKPIAASTLRSPRLVPLLRGSPDVRTYADDQLYASRADPNVDIQIWNALSRLHQRGSNSISTFKAVPQ